MILENWIGVDKVDPRGSLSLWCKHGGGGEPPVSAPDKYGRKRAFHRDEYGGIIYEHETVKDEGIGDPRWKCEGYRGIPFGDGGSR